MNIILVHKGAVGTNATSDNCQLYMGVKSLRRIFLNILRNIERFSSHVMLSFFPFFFLSRNLFIQGYACYYTKNRIK